jgi:hypothetical protein
MKKEDYRDRCTVSAETQSYCVRNQTELFDVTLNTCVMLTYVYEGTVSCGHAHIQYLIISCHYFLTGNSHEIIMFLKVYRIVLFKV